MNPYDILGVGKEADDSTIKKAFQKKAAKAHPDKVGDAAEFVKIRAAYKMLTDKTARERYDRTGEFEEQYVDEESELLSAATGLMMSIIDGVEDVEHIDLVATAVKTVEIQMASLEAGIKDNERTCVKRMKAIKRLARKKKKNQLAAMLENQVAKERQGQELAREQIKHLGVLKDFLLEYTYTVDKQEAPVWRGTIKW